MFISRLAPVTGDNVLTCGVSQRPVLHFLSIVGHPGTRGANAGFGQ